MRYYSEREISSVRKSVIEMTREDIVDRLVSLLQENEELTRKVVRLNLEISDRNWDTSLGQGMC